MFDPDDIAGHVLDDGSKQRLDMEINPTVLSGMKLGSVQGMFDREFPAVESLDFTEDGRFLLSASMYGAPSKDNSAAIALWDASTGELYGGRKHKVRTGCVTSSVKFHPRRDFNMVALTRDKVTGGQDHLVCIDVETSSYGEDEIFPANVKEVLKRHGPDRVGRWHDYELVSKFTLKAKLSTLEISPRGDIVFTAGTEGTDPVGRGGRGIGSAQQKPVIYMWDVRLNTVARQVIGRLLAPDAGSPSLATDPTGRVFAFAQFHGRDGQCIRMYDIRKYSRGPFQEIYIESNAIDAPYQLAFSPNGKYLLTAALEETSGSEVVPVIRTCSSTHGTLYRKISVPVPDDNANREDMLCDAGFTANSDYIYSGCANKSILFWESRAPKIESIEEDAAKPACTLKGHAMPPKRICWCPDRVKFASACYNIAMWFPDPEQLPAFYRDTKDHKLFF